MAGGLSVPEDVVFSDARTIRVLLIILLILEGAFFFLYILWLIRYVRHETGEKQRQLDALRYIYDVEKLLFNAHEHRENVPRALEVITRMLPAQRAAFTMMTKDGPDLAYLWERSGESPLGTALSQSASAMAAYFAAGHNEISAHSPQEVRAVLPDAPAGMDDLAAVPVEDMSGAICGVLAASGLAKRAGCAALLRGVGFSFSMLCSNTITYRTMQRRGERDALTGLYNRNRYEADLPRIGAQCRSGLCCIFMDADGLHELNNSQGHEAGDNMLRAVAKAISSHFGTQYAYRIGGDEFVIFCLDADEKNVARHTDDMAALLARMGHHISAGVAWCPAPVEAIEPLIQQAEKLMYAAKQEYYHTPENDRRAR